MAMFDFGTFRVDMSAYDQNIHKWNKRFLRLAREVSTWSKDPSTKVGCVIVNEDGRTIISTGYNGFPRGVDDEPERFVDRETRLKYTIHAELNAIINAKTSLVGCILYVYPLFSCAECAKAIIQAGIGCVVSMPPREERWQSAYDMSKKMYDEAGIIYDFYEDIDSEVSQDS